MKKYLQACNMNGSIYGRNTGQEGNNSSKDKLNKKESLSSSYSKLYKQQLVAMDKVFGRTKTK